MKKTISISELWAFVNRADTLDEIKTAIDFIEKHVHCDNDLYNDLMMSLTYKLREAYRAA